MATPSPDRELAVIIPAFDELENLKVLLPDISDIQELLPEVTLTPLVVLPTEAHESEVTAVRQLGAQVVIRTPTNSFGDAVRSGIRSIRDTTEYVIFMVADGSHSPARIPTLVKHASAADVVVASRYIEGGRSDNGPLLKAMSIALNRAYSLVLGIKCKDVSTSYKLYKGRDLRQIVLECNNFDIVEEILFRVQDLKRPRRLSIVEVPDHFAQRRIGSTKRRLGPYIASYLWTLARLRFMNSGTKQPGSTREECSRT